MKRLLQLRKKKEKVKKGYLSSAFDAIALVKQSKQYLL